jgi:hypothetical protein
MRRKSSTAMVARRRTVAAGGRSSCCSTPCRSAAACRQARAAAGAATTPPRTLSPRSMNLHAISSPVVLSRASCTKPKVPLLRSRICVQHTHQAAGVSPDRPAEAPMCPNQSLESTIMLLLCIPAAAAACSLAPTRLRGHPGRPFHSGRGPPGALVSPHAPACFLVCGVLFWSQTLPLTGRCCTW